jgi:hypothetical protein
MTAFALALCFGAMVISSENFTVIHAIHDCTGPGCPVCLLIQLAREFIRHTRDTFGAAAFPLIAGAVFFTVRPAAFYHAAAVPVTLKVRLNR